MGLPIQRRGERNGRQRCLPIAHVERARIDALTNRLHRAVAAVSAHLSAPASVPLPGRFSRALRAARDVLPPLHDDYDDEEDGLAELPSGVSLAGYAGAGMEGAANGMQGSKAGEKQIRRRSSKACDQCRKSKCKCERSSQNEQCKNCVLLGTRASSVVSSRVPCCSRRRARINRAPRARDLRPCAAVRASRTRN